MPPINLKHITTLENLLNYFNTLVHSTTRNLILSFLQYNSLAAKGRSLSRPAFSKTCGVLLQQLLLFEAANSLRGGSLSGLRRFFIFSPFFFAYHKGLLCSGRGRAYKALKPLPSQRSPLFHAQRRMKKQKNILHTNLSERRVASQNTFSTLIIKLKNTRRS